MNVPKYAQEMMSRAKFDLSYKNPKSSPGYTIWVKKATPYTYVSTLREECERFVAWARRNYVEAEVLECPKDTHYCSQSALVLITDPVVNHPPLNKV